MRLILLFLLTISLSLENAYASTEHEKFVVYYSDKAPAKIFKDYQLLVLDSRHHPSLRELSESGKTLLGYISIGEVPKTSPFYAALKKNNVLFEENKNWLGSYGVDIRSPMWQKIIVETMVPSLLRDGFNGIFIDTLDSPLEMERANPRKYHGMKEATVNIIKALRMHYPEMKIMVNRAYNVLPDIAPYIDMELGESVRNTYDFNRKSYRPVSENDYKLQVRWLQEAQAINPKLKIYTLDYADKSDTQKIADIYKVQRANGFIPYVTTISLNEVVEEGRAE